MSEVKLLPCPFCGGEAEMLNYSENEYLVACKECGGMVEKWRETEAEAVEQWNTRKPMDRIVERLKTCGDEFRNREYDTWTCLKQAEAVDRARKIVKEESGVE